MGEAEDGQEAVALAASLRPDVVLLDVRMPCMDGLEATRRIMAGGDGRPHVLILTTFDLDDYVYAALQARASGFLLKDASRDDLVHAVWVVAAGEARLAPAVTRRLIAEFINRPSRTASDDSRLDVLTPREREVLLHLARGRSNAEIAAELILGEATVKSHVAHVLMKLDLRDRVQAVIVAYELGLVTPGEPQGGCCRTPRQNRRTCIVQCCSNTRSITGTCRREAAWLLSLWLQTSPPSGSPEESAWRGLSLLGRVVVDGALPE